MTDQLEDLGVTIDGPAEPAAPTTPESTIEPMSGEPEGSTTGDNQGKNEDEGPLFSEKGQQLFNSKMAEEKRQRRELEQKLEEARSKIPEVQAPVSVALPDKYDFDTDEAYNAAVNQWRANEQAVIRADEQNRISQDNQLRQQQETQLQQQEVMAKTLSTFGENAAKVGLTNEELNAAIMQVNNYGIDPNIGFGIMAREDGGLITKYLASNPGVVDQLNQAGGFGAGQLMPQIALEAAKLKPAQSTAPPPADTLDGAGVPEAVSPWLDGVKFE